MALSGIILYRNYPTLLYNTEVVIPPCYKYLFLLTKKALILLNGKYDIIKKMPNPMYTKGFDTFLTRIKKALICIIRTFIPLFHTPLI